ncbi:hypothetical protein POM88_055032 [Heracleum sosnowskyi]|uniref:RRM domain-containing protein n=1 Tax=Heracleum sosnowskyi TaxID=360622 RepID=A0AAD8GM22_9APIA|nr:hypothetical protein POM88_055032 [Heracleum sosnowskyi]
MESIEDAKLRLDEDMRHMKEVDHQIEVESKEAKLTYKKSQRGVKSYVEVISTKPSLNNSQKIEGDEHGEWKIVSYRKNKSNAKLKTTTIYTVGIPPKAFAKDVWQFFSNGGQILDIILPKKTDKFGNRFGFVKTSSEKEARKIIDKLSGVKFLGKNLSVTLARPRLQKENEVVAKDCVNHYTPVKNWLQITDKSDSSGEVEIELNQVEDIVNMFNNCLVGFTWETEETDSLQEKLSLAH